MIEQILGALIFGGAAYLKSKAKGTTFREEIDNINDTVMKMNDKAEKEAARRQHTEDLRQTARERREKDE